ncbi:MFS transporter [Sphingomicrobium clamense]|uniref:MFS transporter n=1 Tax=Sphingomicrobium clamense TaxID=2851013 RepID=A0ABS6V431_9SPHN|nr:MFS transporter [Sphingomicrobium sp. B8]MBW0144313.1 MFS transporter [Sphingomicrobium sp. B8]
MILDQNKPLRLGMMAAFYFTQGVPNGLFLVALPAWVAANGGTALQTAGVAASYMTFWIWKWITAFVMDRYTYLPMGRRRAWIIGAQSILMATFLVSAIINPPADDIAMLSLLGLIAGFGASTQDVGIDGLAVDILREDERSIAAGLMFGSGLIGMSVSGIVGGQLLENVGASAAYLAAATAVGVVLLLGMLVKEREGEKRFPWNEGTAHPRNLNIQVEAWGPLVLTSIKAILVPMSIALAVCMMVAAGANGVADAFHPILTQQISDWSVTEHTNAVSGFGLISGFIAMTVGGWAISKIGEPRVFPVLLGLFAAVAVGFALMRGSWTDNNMLYPLLFLWGLLGVLIQVTFIPIAMRLCNPSVAATQFTIYMAVGNLGRPIGAGVAGGIAAAYEPELIYFAVGGAMAVAAVIALVAKFPYKSVAAVEAVEHDTEQVEAEPVPDVPATP